MRLILEENFNKFVTNEFVYDFDILEKGLYVIEITGRAKSWLQNTSKLISFFKDDDLAVKIDGREFPKLSEKKGLFDSEVAWNGNKLKNLSLINVFFIYLEEGKHALQFIADQSPLLEIARIYQAVSDQNIVFEPVKNYQIESGNRRSSVILILVDLGLERLKIQASANQKHGDDDDLQLRINGERQINDTPKSHKYWYWCGHILKGQSKTFDKKLNLPASLHYIELWTDNTPVLENMELVFLEKGKNREGNIIPYTYKGVYGNEDYNRYDTVIKEVVDYWNNEFLKDTDPPEKILDPNLVKAIMYQESRVGHYSGSEVDVMQVGNADDPAIKTLKGELKEYWIHNGKQEFLEYVDVKIETVRDSIYWGVRWLYHKAQGVTTEGGRYWLSWREAVHEYGPGTKVYTDSVWNIYKNGIKKENNNVIRLWTVAMILLLSTFLLGVQNKTNETNTFKALIIDSFSSDQQLQIQDIEIKSYKDNPALFLAIIEWEKDWWEKLKIGMLENEIIRWLEIENMPTEQSILSARFINLEGFPDSILEVYGKTHMGNGALYLYGIRDDKSFLIFETIAVDSYNEKIWSPENYQNYGYTTCGQTYEDGKLFVAYSDINSDGISDIVLEGKANIICEKEIIADNISGYMKIKVSETPVKRIYLWDKTDRVFIENI